jgi:hypothetical protein
MADPISFHPSELAYVLSYLNVKALIGWGADYFTPPRGRTDAFYADGLARLRRAKRLVPGHQPGKERFSDEISRIAATLADPELVLVTNRKERTGVRVLTQYVSGTHVVELSLRKDGNFHVVEYASLAGAAGAATGFVGATPEPVETPVRIEADQQEFSRIKELAKKGSGKPAVAALVKLGADETAARSAVAAFSKPAASGIISVLYCAGNVTQDAETYAVLTNAEGESWVIFPPGSAEGLVVLERTSVGALTARIMLAISARMLLPG